MNMPQQKTENSVSVKVADFIQKNRIILLGIFIVSMLVIIVFASYTLITQRRNEAAVVLLEAIEEDVENWVSDDSLDDESSVILKNELLDRIDSLAGSYSRSYAAQRALMLKGYIYLEVSDWREAADSFSASSGINPKSYLAPVALMNAGFALEEGMYLEEAVEKYVLLADKYNNSFSYTSEALFSAGRISEHLGNFNEARELYEKIIDSYQGSSWTNPAISRIIYLDARE